ncbi:pyridoxamine 5'-phosphate oxidase family protein [Thalassospira lucentensis]|uniref:pyridoxamine 5'-phosphate oxidase family protein n=1 Tax=Thalassospira lucentensis TaxID=168935 RepID=UPI003D2EC87C
MLNDDIRDYADRSVLCWLATTSEDGPSVSPKEIFACFGEDRIVIANIASPNSVKNIGDEPRVCVSFVDVFSQKGWQLYGDAVLLRAGDDGFEDRKAILQELAGDAFRVATLWDVTITKAKEIIAPSYRFNPDVKEADMRKSAMQTYDVKPVD